MADLNSKYLFTWKIENFSMCPLKNKEILQSPMFKAESLGGSEWCLQLYPRGAERDEENIVSLFLSRTKNEEKEVTDFKLEMSGFDREILESCEGKHVKNNEVGFDWRELISKDTLVENIKNCKKDILIIRCHLKNHSESTIYPACGSEVWTKIGVDQCCFQWNINFFDSSNLNCSKDICFGETNRFKFIFTAHSEINIRSLDKETHKSKVIACKISLMNLKGEKVESKKEIHMFVGDPEKDVWKFPMSFSKNGLCVEDKEVAKEITLKCEVSATNGEILSEFKKIKYEVPPFLCLDNSFSTLQDDLRNTFKTKKNSDVKLRVENSIILAHKYILCARSPVFSAMFDQNMTESKTGTVDIEDIESETMTLFLEFLYTGCVTDLTFENAMKLLIVANKYQVLSLTEKCSMFLVSELSEKSVCDVYAVGDMIDNELLKSAAYEFIAENSAIVLSSDVWSDWMKENVGLANDILFKLALYSS